MSVESREAAIERWLILTDLIRAFEGSSLGDLGIRRLGPPLSWNYEDFVRGAGRGVLSVLDIGTEDGERLASIHDGLPGVVATESSTRNVTAAHSKLNSLGVDLVHAADEQQPFIRNSFDLIINYHSAVNLSEINRMLRPGGMFVTEQVGRGDWSELTHAFPKRQDRGDLQQYYSDGLRDLGFNVLVREHQERVAYPSLAEFACMLAVVNGDLPDFGVEPDIKDFLALERDHARQEGFVVTEDRYLLTARKPAY